MAKMNAGLAAFIARRKTAKAPAKSVKTVKKVAKKTSAKMPMKKMGKAGKC
jgi:hypothetical protein